MSAQGWKQATQATMVALKDMRHENMKLRNEIARLKADNQRIRKSALNLTSYILKTE